MAQKTLKDFYTEYKSDTTSYKMADKTFIRLYGNQFVKYAQQNNYSWEQIVNLLKSLGFKYINKSVA